MDKIDKLPPPPRGWLFWNTNKGPSSVLYRLHVSSRPELRLIYDDCCKRLLAEDGEIPILNAVHEPLLDGQGQPKTVAASESIGLYMTRRMTFWCIDPVLTHTIEKEMGLSPFIKRWKNPTWVSGGEALGLMHIPPRRNQTLELEAYDAVTDRLLKAPSETEVRIALAEDEHATLKLSDCVRYLRANGTDGGGVFMRRELARSQAMSDLVKNEIMRNGFLLLEEEIRLLPTGATLPFDCTTCLPDRPAQPRINATASSRTLA